MDPFPEDWELLSLFECEPETDDYQFKRFDTTIQDDRIWCEIWRDELELKLKWWKNDDLRLDLDLRWVAGMQVETLKGCDAMNITFRESCLLPLRFQLKPFISLSWGTKWNY